MATQVQFRRGTTAQNNSFTGASGEISFDTDILTIRVHDGSLAGGYELARADLSNTGLSTESGAFNYLSATGGLTVSGVSTFVGVGTFQSDVYIGGNLDVQGCSNFVGVVTFRGGTINLGDSNSDDINVGGEFVSNLVPDVDDTYDLGITTQRWRNVNVSGIVTTHDLFVTGVVAGISTFDGNAIFKGDTTIGDSSSDGLIVTAEIGADLLPAIDEILDEGRWGLGSTERPWRNLYVDHYSDLHDVNVSGIVTVASLEVQSNLDVYDTTATFHNNVHIAGNLSIGGTSSTLSAIDLKIEDKDIVLGITTDSNNNDISTDDTANHGGIAIASTEGNPLVDLFIVGIETLPVTYKKFMWFKEGSFSGLGTDAWLSNYAVGIGSTQVPSGVRFAVSNIQFTDDNISAPELNISGVSTLSGHIIADAGIDITGHTELDDINVSGIATITQAVVGAATTFTETLVVQGDARITGILTIGTSSVTIDGSEDTITIGTGVTLTQSGDADYSGIVTATTFSGNLTGNVTGDVNGNVTGDLTGEVNATAFDTNPAGVVVTGVATATTFVGNLEGEVNSTTLDTNPAGVVVTGIASATSFVGSLTGNVAGNVVGNVNGPGISTFAVLKVGTGITASGGIITATTFKGGLTGNVTGNVSGNLTGEVDAAAFDTNPAGVVITGVATAPAFVGLVTGNVTGNINATSGINTLTNSVEIRSNDGSPGRIDYYCEVSNYHYTRVQSASHSEYTGNVTAKLPIKSGDLLVGNTDGAITQNVNTSGIVTATTFSGNLSGTIGTVTTIESTNGTITNLSGTIGTVTTLESTNGTITNLSGTIGTVSNQLSVAGVLTATSGGFEMSVGIATINLADIYQLTPDGSTSGSLNQVPVADGSGGWSWQPVSAAGASEIEGITIREEGSVVGTLSSITTINFVGTNVTADAAELQGIATVTFTDRPTFLSINVTSGVGTVTDLESTNGTITNLSGTIGTVTTFESTNGTITNLSSTNLSGTIGTVTTLESTNGTITNLSSTNLSGTIGTVTTLQSTNGTITNLSSTNLSGTIGTVTNLNSTNLSGTIGTITTLNSTKSNLTNVSVSGITTFTNTTQNTLGNPDTGAVQIDGGLGVNKNATIDGDFDVDGHAEFDDVNVSGMATVDSINVQSNFDVYDTTATFHNNVHIDGNLSIGGTTTSLQAVDLKISDKDIILGITTDSNGEDISTDDTANHGGIAIASTEGNPLIDIFVVGLETNPTTYKKFMWFKEGAFSGLNTDAWLSNYAIGIGSTQFATGTRFAAGQIQITENTISSPQLSISGVSTFSGDIDADGGLDVDGHTELDDVNITGVATIGNVIVGGATTDLLVNGNARITGILTIGTGSITIDSATNFIGIGTNVPSGDSNSLSMFSEDSDPPGAGSFRIAGPLQKIVYNGLDVGLLSGTYSGGVYGLESSNANSLVAVGILSASASSSLGIATANSLQVNGIGTITGDAFVGSAITMYASAGIVSATSFFGDGSGLSNTGSTLSTLSGTERVVLTNLTSGTMTASSTDANLTFNSDGDVLQAGAAVTVYGTAGIVSATSFFGDGSGLSNTGSTLSDLSGTERIVLTSLTSGTMTSSSTDSNLTFNSTGDVLQAGVAVTVYGTAGIVSATSFFGDGSGLSNTGSTLSATSGTERVVLTNLTSGTMTASSTDADLTFDSVSNTLLATNLSVSGIATATTIDSSTFKNYAETVTDLGTLIDGTNDIDISNGNVFYGTLPTSGTVTFTFTTGLTAGAVSFTLYLKNGASGTPTLAWPAAVKFPGGSAPDRTTTADKTDIWTFSTFNNGTDWYGDIAMYNL